MFRILTTLVIAPLCLAQTAPTAAQFVKSLSGPSGKVIGSEFVLDETRSRFLYPQDRTMVVTFLWNAPVGDHTMTAVWKGPDGRVVYISPDVRVQTQLPELRGYWVYELYPTTQSGFWTIEVRVDGQPAGTHNFELVIPVQQSTTLSTGEIYRASVGSLVWVHGLSADGRRATSANGFVIGKDRVATSFQSIDSATSLEIEFANGRIARTQEIWNTNRLQDWAVVKADTQEVAAIPFDAPDQSYVGERLVLFNVEERGTRAFGGVDITGAGNDPLFGPRILFSPRVPPDASGGPLLSLAGKVVGIVGGSDRPGARVEAGNSGRLAFLTDASPNSASPVSLITEAPIVPTTLQALASNKVLTTPIVANENFVRGWTSLPASDQDSTPLVTDFSRRDTIVVRSDWEKRTAKGKGLVGARVYDAQNRPIADSGEKAISLPDKGPVKFTVSLKLSGVPKGSYRVDVEWDAQPVWRTFVTIVD